MAQECPFQQGITSSITSKCITAIDLSSCINVTHNGANFGIQKTNNFLETDQFLFPSLTYIAYLYDNLLQQSDTNEQMVSCLVTSYLTTHHWQHVKVKIMLNLFLETITSNSSGDDCFLPGIRSLWSRIDHVMLIC